MDRGASPSSPPAPQPGPAASLRALGASALDMLRTRLELLAVEYALERNRLAELALYAALALLLAFLALVLGVLALVVLFWDTPWRTTAAVTAAVVPALAAAACAWVLVAKARAGPGAFASSLEALAADVAALR